MRSLHALIRTAGAPVIGIPCLSLLLGCAAQVPGDMTGAGRPNRAAATPTTETSALTRARLAERHEVGATEERQALEARAALDAAFEEGKAAYLSGNVDQAFDQFDRAVEDIVLRSSLDLSKQPELAARVEEVVSAMHGLAIEEADEETATDDDGLSVAGIGVDAEDLADGQTAPLHPSLTGDPSFTIPPMDHPAVDAMIGFYTGRGKERFEVGLQRYGLYAPTIRRILAEEGMPPDLIWLSAIESNFNAQAHSRAKAKGLWQFISGTGRKYGLEQDFWIDERSDFEKATRSACRYLRTLHDMFGDWHLALAAYNAGEGRISRAIRMTGKNDFWEIRKTRHIRVETKNYVPAFIAVMTIMHDPASYGLSVDPLPPLEWDTATVRSCTDLSVIAKCAGTTTDQICLLNGELRRGTTPGGDVPYTLRVPRGSREAFEQAYAQLPAEQRLTWQRHVVRPGETLSIIARHYGSNVAGIMAANKLGSANRIGVGWTLLVPTGATLAAVEGTALASAAPRMRGDDDDSPAPRRSATRTYRVRSGDTLTEIASRHGTSVSRILALNGLRSANRIRVGQSLVIASTSKPRPAAASAASRRKTHVVKPGDTLTKIAQAYQTTVDDLRQWNKLSRRGTIHPGERLTIFKD